MMKEKKKLIEVMPSLLTDGAIFKHIPLFGEATAIEMGIAYSLRHSGQKYVNSFVENYIDNTGTVSESGIETIGNILKLVYGNNWTRIYDALMSEYNPIHNYSMTEKGTDKKTGTDSTDSSIGEQTITNDFGASVETHNLGQGSITDIYGSKLTTENIGAVSNTDTQSPLNRSEVHGDENETILNETNGLNEGWVNEDRTINTRNSVTNTITEQERTASHTEQARTNSTNEGEYTNTHNESAKINTVENSEKTDTQKNSSREDSITTTYDTTNTHEFSRDGNIGVTTTQQMIQSEIDLRTYNFYEQIFADIDKYICLSVY